MYINTFLIEFNARSIIGEIERILKNLLHIPTFVSKHGQRTSALYFDPLPSFLLFQNALAFFSCFCWVYPTRLFLETGSGLVTTFFFRKVPSKTLLLYFTLDKF